MAGRQRLQHLAGSGVQDADLAGGSGAGHKQPRAVRRQYQSRGLPRQRQPPGDLAQTGAENQHLFGRGTGNVEVLAVGRSRQGDGRQVA